MTETNTMTCNEFLVTFDTWPGTLHESHSSVWTLELLSRGQHRKRAFFHLYLFICAKLIMHPKEGKKILNMNFGALIRGPIHNLQNHLLLDQKYNPVATIAVI